MQLLKMKFGKSYHIFFGFLGLHFYDNTSGTVFPAPFKIKKPGSNLLSRLSSIIGVRELDFRVRDGNGYNLSTMATRQ